MGSDRRRRRQGEGQEGGNTEEGSVVLHKGTRVWWLNKKEETARWTAGYVAQVDVEGEEGVVCVVEDDGGGGKECRKVKKEDVVPANPPGMDGIGNLTNLSFLHDAGILAVLQHRHGRDVIYTHAGPVLVAVNPFKNVDGVLYSDDVVKKYVDRPVMGEGSYGYEPHIFLTADQAFKEVGCCCCCCCLHMFVHTYSRTRCVASCR